MFKKTTGYIYKFIKNGKSIWVAWNDNVSEKKIVIPAIDSDYVIITDAVPVYSSGKEVTDYSNDFNVKIQPVSGAILNLLLDKIPVFIEEV